MAELFIMGIGNVDNELRKNIVDIFSNKKITKKTYKLLNEINLSKYNGILYYILLNVKEKKIQTAEVTSKGIYYNVDCIFNHCTCVEDIMDIIIVFDMEILF